MSWASGSYLFSEIIESLIRNRVDPSIRAEIYTDLIDAFENADCDTLYECVGDDFVFDRIMKQKYKDEENVEIDWEM